MDADTRTCWELFDISSIRNVEGVDKHGGFNTNYPRQTVIGGTYCWGLGGAFQSEMREDVPPEDVVEV